MKLEEKKHGNQLGMWKYFGLLKSRMFLGLYIFSSLRMNFSSISFC